MPRQTISPVYDPAPPPGPPPKQLPALDNYWGELDLRTLAGQPPFRACVVAKRENGRSAQVILQIGKQRVPFMLPLSLNGAQYLYGRLEEGKEYQFPTIIETTLKLGIYKAGNIMPRPEGQGPFPLDKRMTVLDLLRCPPFRAKITHKSLEAGAVGLTLARHDGQYLTAWQRDAAGLPEARRLAKELEMGTLYEFPLPPGPPHMDDPQPPTPAMRRLAFMVGEWQYRDMPDKHLRLTWKRDGTGLWVEVLRQNAATGVFFHGSGALLTYDAARDRYLESRIDLPGVTEHEWDEEHRALTRIFVITSSRPGPPQWGASLRAHVSDDEMLWKTAASHFDGTPNGEKQDHLIRLPPRKLPGL